MSNIKSQPVKIEKEYNFATQVFIFTVLFAVTALGVYLAFIVCDRSFIINGEGNIDGIAQEYPTYGYIKHFISEVLNGENISDWSWDIGLGASTIDFFKSKFLNPLTYIIMLFPEEYFDVGYDIVIVIRQYLLGITFMFFARGMSLNQNQRIVGALCYVYCGWAIISATTHPSFLNGAIVLPLLILGAEKVLKNESPILFIISIFLCFVSGVLWAYIGGITVIFYYIIRYLCEYNSVKEGRIIQFIKKFGVFVGYGLIGIMISSCLISSMLLSMLNTTTNNQVDNYGVLYTLKDYLTLPAGFFELDSVNTPYSVLYIPIICIIIIPIIITNLKKKSTPAIIVVVLFIAGLFPVTGKIFNGFSYTVGRWYFVFAFFFVWAAMECMTKQTFSSKKNLRIMAIWLAVLAVWNIGVCYFAIDIIDDNAMFATLIGLVFGLLIIATAYLREFKWQNVNLNRFSIYQLSNMIIVVILMGSIIGTANMTFYPGVSDLLFKYEERGETYEKFSKSTQKAAVKLEAEDEEFFRTDQVDGYNDTRVVRMFTNENIYWGYRSIYTYFSTISSKWLEFNKLMGNNCGYFDRTVSFSNDNRAALDTLLGVKYFLGDSETKRPGASEYRPYGFEYYETIDGVEVFKNNYSIGLGTCYNKYITESELLQFDALEREQVILQAAVVPDEYEDKVSKTEHADLEQLKTEISTVDYEICDEDNLEISEDGKMTVFKDGGSFKLNMDKADDCQVIVSFENLVREKCDYKTKLRLSGTSIEQLDDNLATKYIKDVSYMDNERFKIYVSKGNVEKAAINNKGKNQGFSDIVNFNVNLGYYDTAEGEIDIYIDNFGEYTFDDIKIYAMPMDIYEESAETLVENRLNISEFDDEYVKGSVDLSENSILYLSILDTPGWKVYVDGEITEKINNTNIAFTGVEISNGYHNIELKYSYPGMKIAYLITLAGIAFVIMIVIYRKRRGCNHSI